MKFLVLAFFLLTSTVAAAQQDSITDKATSERKGYVQTIRDKLRKAGDGKSLHIVKKDTVKAPANQMLDSISNAAVQRIDSLKSMSLPG